MRAFWALIFLAGCGRLAFDGQSGGDDDPLDGGSDEAGGDAMGFGAWTDTLSTMNAPSARGHHVAVWTGDRMLVYGGHTEAGGSLGMAALYDPVADTWTTMAPEMGSVPPVRGRAAGVWTGTQLIVWGGDDGGTFSSGGRYTLATNTWEPMSLVGAPGGRMWMASVWTGTEMLVWAGNMHGTTSLHIDGGRYKPMTDTWGTPITTTNAPGHRNCPSAVWTGSEMIIWGGWRNDVWLDDGGRYDPVTNTWGTPISRVGAPSPRTCASSVWTGTEMIVWGGSDTTKFADGGAYDPATDTWRPIATAGAPTPRWGHSAVWTGTEMIIWGGDLEFPPTDYVNDGKRFIP